MNVPCCRFYFAYCEAAFDARYIHDFQVTWRKAADGEATASEAAPSSAAAALQAVQHPSDPVTQVSGFLSWPAACSWNM